MTQDSQGRPIRHGPYPELTLPAVLVGYALGVLIAVSIGYAALILGFSIEGSELAAILGWGVLRGVMRRASIVENNINQTIASAVNGASSGMMFSVPALFILETKYPGVTSFDPKLMVLACVTGAIVGLCFVIPLRKQMIDFNRLAYPGGIAVATILKSPGAGMRKAVFLLAGAAISGAVTLTMLRLDDPLATEARAIAEEFQLGTEPAEVMASAAEIEDLLHLRADDRPDAVAAYTNEAPFDLAALTARIEQVPADTARAKLHGGDHPSFALGAWRLWPSYLNVTLFLSLMTIGVGFLSGRGGLWFGAGGFLCYFFLAPLLAQFGGDSVLALFDAADSNSVPGTLRGQLFKPSGIGMLIGAAIGSIFFAAPLILSAIRSMQESSKQKGGRGSDEMPIRMLYLGVGIGSLVLIALTKYSVDSMDWGRATMMAMLGVLWVWIAGVIVSECLGRTNWSPLSGMTLIAVTILILIADGIGSTEQIVSSVILGAAICVAISQAGDMMLDLKSGYLVGASPRKQQIGQMLGTWLGPIVIMGLIFVLHQPEQGRGLGSESLPAPQGQALASMIESIVDGNVPTFRYIGGGLLGLLFALSGFGGIGVLFGLGFYMPFDIVLTYTLGNFLRIAVDKFGGRGLVENVGIPIAAGLIVGEALVGVGNAMTSIDWSQLFGGGGS